MFWKRFNNVKYWLVLINQRQVNESGASLCTCCKRHSYTYRTWKSLQWAALFWRKFCRYHSLRYRTSWSHTSGASRSATWECAFSYKLNIVCTGKYHSLADNSKSLQPFLRSPSCSEHIWQSPLHQLRCLTIFLSLQDIRRFCAFVHRPMNSLSSQGLLC